MSDESGPSHLHLVADGNALTPSEIPLDELGRGIEQWYQELGGDAFFDRLATSFYALVAEDDVLAPLFDANWTAHARRLAAHFHRLYGRQRLNEAWSPRLLTAHTHTVIGHHHRQRWMALFREAGRRVDAQEPHFTELTSVVMIAASSMMAASRGAAIGRGESIDIDGRAR